MHEPGPSSARDVLSGLATFKSKWPGGWSWDARLDCICSSFRCDDNIVAETAIKPLFPIMWSEGNLRESPILVQQLVERCGGLRAEQFMYCSQPVGGSFLFGLWWPWGDDVTLSFRLGLGGATRERDLVQLRDLFAVDLY